MRPYPLTPQVMNGTGDSGSLSQGSLGVAPGRPVAFGGRHAVLIAASTAGCQEYALFEPIVAPTREYGSGAFVDNKIRLPSSGVPVDNATRIPST